MTKPKRERIKLSISAAEKVKLRRGKPSYVPLATWVKELALWASGHPECPGVPAGDPVAPEGPSPDPAPARGTSQEEIIEEEIPLKPPVKGASKKRSAAALVDQEITSDIVAHLNATAGTTFRLTGQSARQLISARLGEGYTVEDIKAVTEKKCAEWLGTKYEQYLRPSTLWGKEKYEQYHGQKAGTQRSLDLTTEAGKAQCRADSGLKDEYKPRPNLEEYLAKQEREKNG